MDDNGSNGRVQFGPASGNSIPQEWVEPLLRRLFAQYRETLGKMIAETAAEWTTGTAVKASKARQ